MQMMRSLWKQSGPERLPTLCCGSLSSSTSAYPCVMNVCRFVCCCGSVVAVAVAHACLVALFVASAGVAPIGSAVAVAVAAAAPFGVASDGCRCGGAVASWLCWFWCWFWSCLGGVLESLFGAGVFLGGCCGVVTLYSLCSPPPQTKQNLGTEHDGPGPHRCRGQSQLPLAHA